MKNFINEKLLLFTIRIKKIEKNLYKASYKKYEKKFNNLSKEYYKLKYIINLFNNWKKNEKIINQHIDLFSDVDLCNLAKEECKMVKKKNKLIEKKIYNFFSTKTYSNKNGCYIEIRSASGGDEASIFAGDLFKMYIKYADRKKWKTKIMNIIYGDRGGFKEAIIKVNGRNSLKNLNLESGGHRVQRIPKTENQGRTHTSTCTVAIIPDSNDKKKIFIKNSDLRIDTFKSSGAGGQHVNTTDSAIRITHLPTGNVVECQNERSQHKNKSKAMEILYARIKNQEEKKNQERKSNIRKSLLGSGERSDRNRTYNFSQNRITDHRIDLSLYCLDKVLNGDLDLIIKPVLKEYKKKMFLKLNIKDI
ncbi:peptide chain release factor 1 [Buchnera aphidicola (Ceratoglyphina bambusae)]|uniref:peptide chain release factor 1 n=1 Tax=Buchnera aphidicola TaxID=9 RepID=UPI0031B875F3